MRVRIVALSLLGALLAFAGSAVSHPERLSFFPDHTKGKVPVFRSTGPALVVCKEDSRARIKTLLKGKGPKTTKLRKRNLRLLKKCRFRHIQDAVEQAKSNYRILILPGVYKEEPSRAVPFPEPKCKDMFEPAMGPDPASGGNAVRQAFRAGSTAGDKAPSYEYSFTCPRSASLITVAGDDPKDPDKECDQKCNLQIEGTARRQDVLITSDGLKLNLIFGDRADGIALRNFTVKQSDFNNIYVLETNGFRFSNIVSESAREYGFLSFASDNGLYEDLDASYSGDSGIYPGSGPEGHCARYGIEIRRVNSHHNALGFSGTAGNGIWVHDSKFHNNSIGLVEDSFAPGHPGQPQDCLKWEGNEIFSNNENYFTEENQDYCRETAKEAFKRDPKRVCPVFQVPVGTGFLLAGGNGNIVRDNYFYDNDRRVGYLFAVPASFRGEDDSDKSYDTSHSNQITGNHVGFRKDGTKDPNGGFFWWDGGGQANCWEGNRFASATDALIDVPDSYPKSLPPCPKGSDTGIPQEPRQFAEIVPCLAWDANDDDFSHPPGCDWFDQPKDPGARAR